MYSSTSTACNNAHQKDLHVSFTFLGLTFFFAVYTVHGCTIVPPPPPRMMVRTIDILIFNTSEQKITSLHVQYVYDTFYFCLLAEVHVHLGIQSLNIFKQSNDASKLVHGYTCICTCRGLILVIKFLH